MHPTSANQEVVLTQGKPELGWDGERESRRAATAIRASAYRQRL